MTLTPAIKRQLTIASRFIEPQMRFHMVFEVYQRHMPREQAKHATRNYLSV